MASQEMTLREVCIADAYEDQTAVFEKRIAELEDALIGAEIVIRMLAPAGQETTLATIRRALRRDN